MNLLTALKQTKPFEDGREEALVNILYTSNWLINKQKALLEAYDITLKQYNILRILRGSNEPLSTSEIRLRMLDKMSDVSRIVDRMASKGIVTKQVRSCDQRKVDIHISKNGDTLLNRINEKVLVQFRELVHLDKEQTEMLNLLLDQLRVDPQVK